MITEDMYYHTQRATRVLENAEAVVFYYEWSGTYEAVEKQMRGAGFGVSPYYHRSTRGDFKRAKKAFEKYSQNTMKALRG